LFAIRIALPTPEDPPPAAVIKLSTAFNPDLTLSILLPLPEDKFEKDVTALPIFCVKRLTLCAVWIGFPPTRFPAKLLKDSKIDAIMVYLH
jgi:hypothetical protein